jgi:hypothetical protein
MNCQTFSDYESVLGESLLYLCIFTEQDSTRAAKTTFVYCGSS